MPSYNVITFLSNYLLARIALLAVACNGYRSRLRHNGKELVATITSVRHRSLNKKKSNVSQVYRRRRRSVTDFTILNVWCSLWRITHIPSTCIIQLLAQQAVDFP